MILRIIKNARCLFWLKRDPIGYARSRGVTIGSNCRLLGLTVGAFGSEPYLVSLGNHVTVTDGVSFVTHDGGVWVFREEQPDIDIFGPIRVGNNVFIGINSIIMPGVTIGNNCIIAAGSVVTRDVPDDTIFGGVPAKLIKNISEYREGVLKHALHIRSCRPEEKRSFLLDYFK